jgi:hypothetical protein
MEELVVALSVCVGLAIKVNFVENVSILLLLLLLLLLLRILIFIDDRLCGIVVRVLGYRSEGPGSILGTTRKQVVGPKRGPLSLVSTTEELLDRKVVAPV